jgi:hypothetical protein
MTFRLQKTWRIRKSHDTCLYLTIFGVRGQVVLRYDILTVPYAVLARCSRCGELFQVCGCYV